MRNDELLCLSLALLPVVQACGTTGVAATGQGTPISAVASGSTAPTPDPLAALAGRFPEQRYLSGRGQAATPDAARAAAKQRLLESIQSSAQAVSSQSGQPRQAEIRVAGFKHAALIKVIEPVAAEGGYVSLAVLDRQEAAPFLEMEIKAAREKLEAWRKQMLAAVRERALRRVLDMCIQDPSPLLEELDSLRLSLAVVQGDAEGYRTFDDLRSVLELQIAARKLLDDIPTTVVLEGDGGDPQTAARIGDLIMKHATERGLKARLASQPSREGLLIKVRPDLEWSQDGGFHFLRSGLVLQASFAGSPEAFLQLDVERNRTKEGGVQKTHAQRGSMKKLDKILGEELKPKLPSLACQTSLEPPASPR
ncbi:MAG: hypothetical protein FJ125_16305 [Deltaproteobacteria bacterium]|nr:hypothetical protein [Deltaproteobacteria bacterium]